MMTKTMFPYTYAWGNNPVRAAHKGKPCRVVVWGGMNSCLVEFQSGARLVTSRNALRKRKEGDDERMNTQRHLSGNLTLEALLAAKEELRTPPPPFEIWVASYGPDGMNALSLPAVSVLGVGVEFRYSHSLADRVVIMRKEVLESLLANGTPLEGIPIYYMEAE